MNTPINCAIYSRVSTDLGLKQEFNSIHAQIDSCQHYIAMNKHNGWQHDPEHVFTDAALSGASTERPALQTMLKLVRAKKIQVVLIYKIDRLSRNLRDFIEMQELFTEHGCALVSTTESFDTSTAMGRAMLNLVGVFAQLERERIRERITDKIAATKSRGLWVGGVPPYGYRIKDKKLKVDRKRADIVKRIFQMRTEGQYPQAIASQLRRQSVPFHSARNGDTIWTARHVSSILRCPTYAGYLKHKDALHQGVHEALVKRDIWEQVQKLMGEDTPQQRLQRTDYPLRGLITCANCKTTFTTSSTVSKGVRHRYYVCSKRQKNGRAICACPSLPAASAEKHLLQELISLINQDELEKTLYAICPETSKIFMRDGLANRDILLSRLTHQQQASLFRAVYKSIVFDPIDRAFLLTTHSHDNQNPESE